ncbi:MAG: ribosome biogenesis GTPase YlqF [Pelotomaculum sp.]|uniref:Ribosome biogenesis GTPase A n=1 Tax=Pelotomaculum thermopropionicum (strain DSM 13744 / JCM 10971 / SI) TaxID=370438 RepID=A5D1J1_PELTS|nr:ribosome biogenesis GTPase YlqF [Pelotomaculum sp.]BAF59897.1 predicted GTPase [Pelotomaculum thermopropionicum SI]
MDIHWYPGHMAKARRQVKEDLRLADVVIEVLDARIPASSRNPDIGKIAGSKPRLIVLNKSDLADPVLTGRWMDYFKKAGYEAADVDSVSGRGVREIPGLVEQLAAPKIASLANAGRRPRAARCMVLGIPNVGKSFLINKLVGRRVVKTGSSPGVTRGKQWVRLTGNLELMDTPGILRPRLDDPVTAFHLAVTGAVKEEVFNLEKVAGRLLKWLMENYPDAIRERYRLEDLPEEPEEMLNAIGARRGYFMSGGAVDLIRSSRAVLKEFREGKMGRFTLEKPPQSI